MLSPTMTMKVNGNLACTISIILAISSWPASPRPVSPMTAKRTEPSLLGRSMVCARASGGQASRARSSAPRPGPVQRGAYAGHDGGHHPCVEEGAAAGGGPADADGLGRGHAVRGHGDGVLVARERGQALGRLLVHLEVVLDSVVEVLDGLL